MGPEIEAGSTPGAGAPVEVHQWLVDMVRAHVQGNPHAFDRFEDLSDAEVSAMMFHRTDREGKPRGMQLTPMGLKLVTKLFKNCKIDLEGKRPLTAKQVLFLDRNCTMPYFTRASTLVLFDMVLATKLRLCGDDLDTLISIEN